MASREFLTLIEGGAAVQREISTDYAEALAPECGEFYGSLGLNPVILDIATRHISDLHVIVGGDNNSTNLGVQQSSSDEKRANWIRTLRFGASKFRYCESWLGESLGTAGVELNDDMSKNLTLEMLVYEATADVVANAYYMQRHFDRYMPGFNGQAPFYETELSIARAFLTRLGATEPTKQEIRDEYFSFRSGAALAQLQRSLIRNGIAEDIMASMRLKKALADRYTLKEKVERRKHDTFRIVPQAVGEMRERLLTLEPTVRKKSRTISFVLGLVSDKDL